MEKNRTKILEVTEQLLNEIGRDAITIRAVAEAASVQAPTLYRLFGDKKGLLNAVSEEGFSRYMTVKNEARKLGPMEEFRQGWDIHVDFGLEHPELYKLMFGEHNFSDPSPAALVAYAGLDQLMAHLAASGSLKVSQEEATFAAFASASGVVLTLLSLPKNKHADDFRTNARERLILEIMNSPSETPDTAVQSLATTLSAKLDDTKALSTSEKNLLKEWLGRIS